MKLMANVALAVLLTLVVGCSALSSDPAHELCAGETCPVCRYRNDLACVCVKEPSDTLKVQHEGRTYHFCSESCRREFVENPATYLPSAAAKN